MLLGQLFAEGKTFRTLQHSAALLLFCSPVLRFLNRVLNYARRAYLFYVIINVRSSTLCSVLEVGTLFYRYVNFIMTLCYVNVVITLYSLIRF